MGKITKVPNGPLIKKKGPYAGSTLKAGGKVKKGQVGMSVPKPKTGEHTGAPIGEYKPQGPSVGKYGGEGAPIGVSKYAKKGFKTGGKVKKAMLGAIMNMAGGKDNPIYKKTTAMRGKLGSAALGIPGMKPIVKNGNMIKRADGSYSKRGLWDNIRANKGSGKKPTAAMLKQERKIKAKK